MRDDPFEEDNSARLRKRLWGVAVLIAAAVIVLPFILDGAGSESQFRRVERLREEPPAILDSEGNRTVQEVPEMRAVPSIPDVRGNKTAADVLSTPPSSPMTAWVVKVEEFSDEQQALKLRDRLRREGFASFVRERSASTDPFSVLVGPMIKQDTAERARGNVAALLQNSPTVTNYP